MKQAFMVVFGIDIAKGGIMSSLLTRSKMFLDNNIDANIITFDYKTDYNSIVKELKNSGKMDKRINMYNQLHFFEEKSINNSVNSTNINEKYDKLINDCLIVRNNKKNDLFSKETGEYVGLKTDKGKSATLDLYHLNYMVKRVYYLNNRIIRIKEFNQKNEMITETFFNRDGQPFLKRYMSEGAVSHIYLLIEEKHFNNNQEFGTYFLEQLIEDNNENIIICDGIGSFNKIKNTNHNHVQKYAIMHKNHKSINGNVKRKEGNILENGGMIDGIIFFTDKQLNDAKQQYNLKNAHLINNFVREVKEKEDYNTSKIVGTISRLDKLKGFDLLIDVAKKVVAVDKEVQFYIYGEGDNEYKDSLKELIEQQGLTDNVKLKGYTLELDNVLSTFRCYISTSQTESQGLSMVEAMLNGTPVVAFDVDYGPSQFIFNDVNGYLIENKNIENMANSILELTEDQSKAINIGKEARETILKEFDIDKIMSKWISLFDK
ncbi:glycosyltransferase [Mammaliicoccus sp. R-M62]|uniref:glycosyltransferase n=1 Tax=Mammaliicoccus sp. R-M62 TaxID=2898721 RepID=UPI001EFC0D1F|nr:glycosyltransferase [Mammaliicoccus sp. R-M62]